jgi:hypothetical protein
MRHIRNRGIHLFALLMLATTCFAEDAAPSKFYKLDFVVKEVEGGKVLNARSYSAIVAGDKGCVIRTGSKVPFPTQAGPGVGGAAPSTYSFLEVGVSIDCHHVREATNGLSLDVNADISSLLQESSSLSSPPVVRQNKWGSIVLVPLRKPSVLFSSDDLTSKHQMQLELTATPIT